MDVDPRRGRKRRSCWSRNTGNTLIFVVALLACLDQLSARTKNAKLELRLKRTAPVRNVPAWEHIPLPSLSTGMLARMKDFRGASSSKEQLLVVDEFVHSLSENNDDSAALLLVGLLLRADSGPMAERVERCVAHVMSDVQLSTSASLFVRWLIASEEACDLVQKVTGIRALLGVKGRQAVFARVCSPPGMLIALVGTCLAALQDAAAKGHDSLALFALNALQNVLQVCHHMPGFGMTETNEGDQSTSTAEGTQESLSRILI